MRDSTLVAVVSGKGPIAYPSTTPYPPGREYPEFGQRLGGVAAANPVYDILRALFRELGFDSTHWETADWNPLGDVIRPGQKVLIKPNLVRHDHSTGGDYRAVITHPSVVRAIADYVALALHGSGQIVVGDAPVQGTNFDTLLARSGLREVCADVGRCWGIPVRLADFRLWSLQGAGSGWHEGCGEHLPGDSAGYREVDLGRRSMLEPLDDYADRFRVTCYDATSMRKHHNPTRHEYIIAGAVLDADVVINVPKLKTHRKVGLTAALKNLVGINGHKDWLPHHRFGSTQEGGDEYLYPSRLKRARSRLDESVYRQLGSRKNPMRRLGIRILDRLSRHVAADPFHEGSWYGNDTCWRMSLDLNRLLYYADRDGHMTDTIQRRTLTIVDAIVAGEGEGPMRPDPRLCNLLVGGANPVAVDALLAGVIGFDYRKLPIVARAFDPMAWPLVGFEPEDIVIRSNDERFSDLQIGIPSSVFCFKPPAAWVEHLGAPVPSAMQL